MRSPVNLRGSIKERPFNAPNDLDIDDQGRIYFTDPRYFGHEPIEQPIQGVYRLDTDGSVHLILADVAKPNGIVISPNRKTLYVRVDVPSAGPRARLWRS